MIKRVFADAVLVVSFLWFPWWATAFLAIIFMFIFSRFWEGVLVGVVIDSLYGGAYFTIGFLIAIFLLEKFKSQLF